MAHAKWSPSSAHRWMECFASMAEEIDYTRVGSSSFADEGTAAHTLLDWTLNRPDKVAADFPDSHITVTTLDDEGNVACSSDNEVTDEMRDSVMEVVDKVRALVALGWTLYTEQRVDFSNTIGIPNQFGTSDIILVSPDGKRVLVIDFKYGKGIKVYAEKNHQMLCYAVGVLETFDGLLGDFEEFVLVVAQPRLSHFDEWECSRADVIEHGAKMRVAAENNVSAIAWRAKGKKVPDAFYKPGHKTCQWCKHKHACKPLEKMVVDEVMQDFTDIDAEEKQQQMAVMGTTMPAGERLGLAFSNLELVEMWVSAVRAEAERQVHAGMQVIGIDGLPLKLIEGRKGNRAWTDKEMAEAMLVGQIGDRAYEPRELISVSKAAKILDKKKTAETWANFKEIINQPPGRPRVVLGSIEGTPYSGAVSDEEFSPIEAEE